MINGAPTTNDIIVFAIWLSWSCLSLTPVALKNPAYSVVISTQQVLEKLMLISNIAFAPGLLDVVQSKTPPIIFYFKSLPLYLDKVWAIYVIVLEQGGCRPIIYIGSGTHSRKGVAARMYEYDIGHSLPRFIQRALDNGYKITHRGLLCWTPRPESSARYKLRALLLVLEFSFSMYFRAMVSRSKDYGIPPISPWSVDIMTYDGCCSHLSVNETIYGSENEGLTSEQIDAVESEMKRNRTRRNRLALDPKKKASNQRTYRAKAVAEKRFSCATCNINCKSSFELLNHKLTQKHIRNAAGITKAERLATNQANLMAENRASRRYYCSTCDYAASTQQKLNYHLQTRNHLSKVALAQSSSQLD